MKEYDTYVNTLDELPDGKEGEIYVRDLAPGQRKYNTLYVRAQVASSAEKLPKGDTLWIRFPLGKRHPQPWKIKVLEELVIPAEKA